jgi:SSS family solute:Na+ symporter
VFLLGVFWKRASGKSAFITLFAGMALGAAMFVVDWNGIYKGDFMLIAFLLFVACVIIMAVTTFVFPEALKQEAKPLVWASWSEPLRAKCGSGLSDYRVMSGLILAIFAVLYIIFR